MFNRFHHYILLFLITFLAGCSLFQERLPAAQRTELLSVQHHPTETLQNKTPQTLKAISLNLAHGRKLSFNQLFVGSEEIRSNLLDIAEFLKQENADIVALQEADQESFWSGDFNHVAFLAKEAGYPWFVSAVHVDNPLGTYGTAILSRLPIQDAFGFTFQPTPPTTNKGYTLVQVNWQPEPTVEGEKSESLIDIVSVHLDFSRTSKRELQLEELALTLAHRDNAAIILGDFNSEWLGEEKVIQKFAEHGKYRAYQPESNSFHSYTDKRLDWVLITNDLTFHDYYVGDEALSDHKPVVVHITRDATHDIAAHTVEDPEIQID